jgi:hypothetical protein
VERRGGRGERKRGRGKEEEEVGLSESVIECGDRDKHGGVSVGRAEIAPYRSSATHTYSKVEGNVARTIQRI